MMRSFGSIVPLMALATAAFALSTCGDDTTQTGPTISILRETGRGCLEVVGTAAPATELELPPPCDETLGSPSTLLAGIDVLELVIDYGDIDVAASSTLAPPMAVITIDGKAAPLMVVPLSQPQTNGHTLFLGTFTVPTVITSDLQIGVSVVNGFSTAVPTVYGTTAPDLAVSALKRTQSGCFAPITSVAPSPALGLAAPCPTNSATMTAGLDLVELVIDYGALDVPDSAVWPSPIVTILVDGVTVAAPVMLSQLQRSNGHSFFLATFRAPASLSSNIRFSVAPSASLPSVTMDTVFATVAAVPEVDVVECDGASTCTASGAVGAIHFLVSVAGDLPQSIAIHSFLDGVPQSDPVGPQMTTADSDGTSVTLAVPVPAAPDGTIWTIEAQLGSARTRSQNIIIQRPNVTATLSCGSSCTLTPGETVGVTISAPEGISPQEALYTTLLDGSPIVLSAQLTLGNIDIQAGTVSTIQSLTAPTQSGTWQIDVSVAGYRSNTLTAQIQ